MKSKVLRIIGLFVLGLVLLIAGLWASLAFFYSGPSNEIFRYALSLSFASITFATLTALFFRRFRWQAFTAYTVLYLLFLAWYNTITPSNTRAWQEDVSTLAYVTKKENLYSFHNIRNFSYKSETDYIPAYYDKTYDLNKLIGIDIIAVYWMGPAVAHVFVSFSFSDGEHLAVSIETRKEQGENYSTLKGFFRQYELYYVVADERDVIGLRTNYRFDPQEDVYVYPLYGSLDDARHLFLTYINQINTLKENPKFYNTLTTNCTTNIWLNATASGGIREIPFSWKILASGYVPEYLYKHDRLYAQGLSFDALTKQVYANDRAKAFGITKDFSKDIRHNE